jgi:hypothetical protein
MKAAEGAKEPHRQTDPVREPANSVTAREAVRMSAEGAKEPHRQTEVFDGKAS